MKTSLIKTLFVLYPHLPGGDEPTDYEKRVIARMPKIIQSCKTYEQYMTASRMVKLAGQAIYYKKPEFINIWNNMMRETFLR